MEPARRTRWKPLIRPILVRIPARWRPRPHRRRRAHQRRQPRRLGHRDAAAARRERAGPRGPDAHGQPPRPRGGHRGGRVRRPLASEAAAAVVGADLVVDGGAAA